MYDIILHTQSYKNIQGVFVIRGKVLENDFMGQNK